MITVILTVDEDWDKLIQEQKRAFDEAKALIAAGHSVPPLLRITYLESTSELKRLLHAHLTSGGDYKAVGYAVGAPIIEELT